MSEQESIAPEDEPLSPEETESDNDTPCELHPNHFDESTTQIDDRAKPADPLRPEEAEGDHVERRQSPPNHSNESSSTTHIVEEPDEDGKALDDDDTRQIKKINAIPASSSVNADIEDSHNDASAVEASAMLPDTVGIEAAIQNEANDDSPNRPVRDQKPRPSKTRSLRTKKHRIIAEPTECDSEKTDEDEAPQPPSKPTVKPMAKPEEIKSKPRRRRRRKQARAVRTGLRSEMKRGDKEEADSDEDDEKSAQPRQKKRTLGDAGIETATTPPPKRRKMMARQPTPKMRLVKNKKVSAFDGEEWRDGWILETEQFDEKLEPFVVVRLRIPIVGAKGSRNAKKFELRDQSFYTSGPKGKLLKLVNRRKRSG